MKKLLVGSYLLITLGIIVLFNNSSFKDNKDFKAIEAGEKIYNQHCASCHGKTGKGEGANVGTSINNEQLLSSLSDKDLYNNVKFGREGTLMPAYKERISEKDIKNLVAFMRDWQEKKIDFKTPGKIAGEPENGRRLYNLYCLSCHGEGGAGKLKMGTALANPQYLQYTTDKQIWIDTAYGREKTRMSPSLKGLDGVRQLKEEEISDVVSYIRSLQIK
ncbi:c-type cytochrome [Neobacillus sp. PS3-34]|uniref:c-type cytochrome n=1 Tax=Neobacillus sp. PS3-34 TaxID=3070678 RepID=UPI0027DF0838|nr:c-type cytochrome [Neobacillus sp. PS3-34]WML47551.1 c-type cytochrome [Neobacillus sp. PS3-34]